MKRALSLLVLASSCRLAASSDAAMKSGTVRSSDGVAIAYDSRGSGDALVFIHCWGGDRSLWKHQLDLFAKDHRVVALDLGGHGESGWGRKTWTVRGLADDVEAVADRLKLKRMILIGSSMGGPVSLETANRMRGRVVGIVAVDTLQNAEFAMTREMVEGIAGRLEADFDGTMREFIGGLFVRPDDPNVQGILHRARRAHRPAILALMRDFANVDTKALLSGSGVPIRAINAAPRGERGMPTAVETNRKYADFDAVILNDVGHFPMLEKPAEFNERLREAIASLERAAAR